MRQRGNLMSIRENPRRAVIFSVCTNHCLGRLCLKVLFHLDHYPVQKTQPPCTRLVLEMDSVPAYKKHGEKGEFIAPKIS